VFCSVLVLAAALAVRFFGFICGPLLELVLSARELLRQSWHGRRGHAAVSGRGTGCRCRGCWRRANYVGELGLERFDVVFDFRCAAELWS